MWLLYPSIKLFAPVDTFSMTQMWIHKELISRKQEDHIFPSIKYAWPQGEFYFCKQKIFLESMHLKDKRYMHSPANHDDPSVIYLIWRLNSILDIRCIWGILFEIETHKPCAWHSLTLVNVHFCIQEVFYKKMEQGGWSLYMDWKSRVEPWNTVDKCKLCMRSLRTGILVCATWTCIWIR